MRSFIRPACAALVAAGALAACSPAPPPAPARKPMTGNAGQALVTSQAHLMGELPTYGNVSWERRDDIDGAAILVLAPNVRTPQITAKVRDGRIVEFVQKGPLARKPLAALAAAAGAASGEHGPTAQKIEALIAQAKTTGREASAEMGGVTYAAAPSGDEVRATPKP
jgi:hypothetical protein